jgi:hypothetical protein
MVFASPHETAADRRRRGRCRLERKEQGRGVVVVEDSFLERATAATEELYISQKSMP